MSSYALIDPVTGRQWTLLEDRLTRNLRLNCILLQDGKHIGIITHRDLVVFTRWCAGEMLTRLVDEPDLKVTHTLTMVDRWLEDERSLSNEELEAAADAAWAASRAAAEAAAWADGAAAGAARAAARADGAAARAAWAAQAAAEVAAEVARAAALSARTAARTAEAAWAAQAAADAAAELTLAASYEAQAQWWVEHLQSGK